MMISTRRFCGSRTPGPVGTSRCVSPKPWIAIALLRHAVLDQFRGDRLGAPHRQALVVSAACPTCRCSRSPRCRVYCTLVEFAAASGRSGGPGRSELPCPNRRTPDTSAPTGDGGTAAGAGAAGAGAALAEVVAHADQDGVVVVVVQLDASRHGAAAGGAARTIVAVAGQRP